MMKILELKDIKVSISGKEVVKGISLTVNKGETLVIMGPNGSGKSTFAHALMGHPSYTVSGQALLDGIDLLELKPDERSRAGLFLSFQHPVEIPGVSISNFLKSAINSHRATKDKIRLNEFMKLLNEKMELLHIPKGFESRYVNEGFSGGEKKKMEILQLAMLNPKVTILDETDSGLDIDALKQVCDGINVLKKENPQLAIIVITHYQRMLDYLKPDRIAIMLDGKIVKIEGPELVKELEKKGYEGFKE